MSQDDVPYAPDTQLNITITCAPSSDGWGFVGQILVGDHEAYRSLRAYVSPIEALTATQALVGGALGALLASEEWRTLTGELGHAPTRRDLRLGLSKGDPSRTDGVFSPARDQP